MQINITAYGLDSIETELFAQKWQKLEQVSDNTIFLSWLWIKAWLSVVDDKVTVIEAIQNEQTVGLSLWVERTRKVLGCSIKQAWLHRTGETAKDQMWIEYNDFLLAKESKLEIRNAMLAFIKQSHLGWQEIIIGLSEFQILKQINAHFSDSYNAVESTGYKVNLTQIKHSYRDEVLSKNTRAHIKRTTKLLNEIGDVTFSVCSDLDAIQGYLPEMAHLHKKRWESSADGSGFNNPSFVNFHRELLQSSSDNVHLCILCLNKKPIGYLYNYCYGSHVSFYLSALASGFSAKIKLGMLLQVLAIEFYQGKNIKSYDFLAGEAQYKASLTNEAYTLALSCFKVNSVILQIENYLRRIKNKYIKIFIK